MDIPLDIEKIRLVQGRGVATSSNTRIKKTYERFIAGPLPLNWITRAAQLGGKALCVAMALWYLKGLQRSETVKLAHTTLQLFGVAPKAFYRALEAMEKEGLIRVSRRPGSSPKITILEVN